MKHKDLVFILGVAFALVAVGVALIIPRLGQAPPPPQLTVAQEGIAKRIKFYESKVEEEPANAAWWVKLGELYFRQGEWDKALENFSKAVELDPQNVDLQIKLAIIYWHSGDIEAGIKQLDQALQLDPSRITTRFYRGILLSTLKGREAEAIAELKEVIKLDPSSELAQRARKRLAELGAGVDASGAPPFSLLPPALGGLPLQSHSEGKEALAEINKLHNGELPITEGYVGRYSDGTRSVTLWIAESDDAQGLLRQMLERIEEGGTPFSTPREVYVKDLEREVEVHSSEGLGQAHYIWAEGRLIIWMALEGFAADEEMEVLKEALQALR